MESVGRAVEKSVIIYSLDGKLFQPVKNGLLDNLPGDDACHLMAGSDRQGIDIILGEDVPRLT